MLFALASLAGLAALLPPRSEVAGEPLCTEARQLNIEATERYDVILQDGQVGSEERTELMAIRELFRQAFQRCPEPKYLHNLVLLSEDLGTLDTALLYCLSLLELHEPATGGKERALCSKLEQRRTTEAAVLQVSTSPPSARLVLDRDGEKVFTAPATLHVLPGVHRLEIAAPGYEERVWEDTVAGKGVLELRFALSPLPARVSISSEPAGAVVHIPGSRELGRTPLVGAELAPGRHVLLLEHPGHEPFALSIELAADERREIGPLVLHPRPPPPLPSPPPAGPAAVPPAPRAGEQGPSPSWGPGRWLATASLGGAVAAAGLGVALHLEAIARSEEAGAGNDRTPSSYAHARSEYGAAVEQANLAIGLYVAAGVLTATGVLLLAMSDGSTSSAEQSARREVPLAPALVLRF
ncbi:MAG: PEGA domain-containing protein [Deltaproteobacteria bacterium]|nr:PEGA domain-containing protein [Deltaproteobacteria bacterium]